MLSWAIFILERQNILFPIFLLLGCSSWQMFPRVCHIEHSGSYLQVNVHRIATLMCLFRNLLGVAPRSRTNRKRIPALREGVQVQIVGFFVLMSAPQSSPVSRQHFCLPLWIIRDFQQHVVSLASQWRAGNIIEASAHRKHGANSGRCNQINCNCASTPSLLLTHPIGRTTGERGQVSFLFRPMQPLVRAMQYYTPDLGCGLFWNQACGWRYFIEVN